jgi:cobalt-precorrin 5A hydrolase/precorrin-3B C17-methyltransferase
VKVLSVSVTEQGRRLAARLPFEHAHGDAARTVRDRWPDVDAFVLFLATGAAVRIVAPLLADKRSDPGVVCVDEPGRFAVALCGGHAGGANALARQVGALLGSEPVVTTATDATHTPALDGLPGPFAFPTDELVVEQLRSELGNVPRR